MNRDPNTAVKVAIAIALSLASVNPVVPPVVPSRPVHGEVKDGWTYHCKNGESYWWRVKPQSETVILPGPISRPFVQAPYSTRGITVRPVAGPNSVYQGQAQGQVRTPTFVALAGRVGGTKGCSSSG